MRILILSNYFPPTRSWGYTQLCCEVAQGLLRRGHDIRVLTSIGTPESGLSDGIWVDRKFHLESEPNFYEPASFFRTRRPHLREDRRALREIVEAHKPHVIFVWGMWNAPKQIPIEVEGQPGTAVAYYISDHWPASRSAHEVYWERQPRRARMRPVKWLLRQLVHLILRLEGPVPRPRFENAMCVSRALRESLIGLGVPLEHARIVHNGIDLNQFSPKKAKRTIQAQPSNGRLRMLVAGRLTHEKGIHTALEASAKLLEQGISNYHLTVLGEGHPDYEKKLRSFQQAQNLENHVTFRDRIDREEMPDLLGEHDLLIFPSIGLEALPRLPMEAMACGLVVVGTSTGGTSELLVEGQTGLTFAAGDSDALTAQISKLIVDRTLRENLAIQGQHAVIEGFSLEKMIGEIEMYLRELVPDVRSFSGEMPSRRSDRR